MFELKLSGAQNIFTPICLACVYCKRIFRIKRNCFNWIILDYLVIKLFYKFINFINSVPFLETLRNIQFNDISKAINGFKLFK